MNYDSIWRSDWFIGMAISLLSLLALSSNLSLMQILENSLYDISTPAKNRVISKDIVLLQMDKQPPNRQQPLSLTIEKLVAAGSKVIIIDTPAADQVSKALIETIQNSGITLISLPMSLEPQSGSQTAVLPAHIKKMLTMGENRPDRKNSFSITGLITPGSELTAASAGLTHQAPLIDADGLVRSELLAVEFSGYMIPATSLALAAKFHNIPLTDIRYNPGQHIELAATTIAIAPDNRIYPAFYINESGNSFNSYQNSQLVNDKTPKAAFKGKIVLIDHGNNHFPTPFKDNMSSSEFSAHSLQSIINNEYVVRPAWAQIAELIILLIATLYLTFILPRLNNNLIASAISALLFMGFIGLEIVGISSGSLWIQTTIAALLIVIGHLLITGNRHLNSTNSPQITTDPNETNKMLGLSFQNQGMLEKAFEKYQNIPADESMPATLYELALAFERKRQFDQALNVYQQIASFDKGYRDIQTRIINATTANESFANDNPNAGIASLLSNGESKPTLGRYEIIDELGKGAMGTVYLGKDPKINRRVAIKTMALSREFDPDELEEIKERFFHEAEIAGMLNHPNIVTIFDVGDEQDLAYIAMEYLDGIDLIPYTKKSKILPINTTLRIVAKVAEALQYAHNHGVIHRDIKPANIMILKNKTVKVTDFGIAHITESSKSKAGVVLGTPSYMSPEQLSGKTIDGRSDIFSLGVMLYEMVSGVRPFKADSISKLMFKIAKEPHADVREHNPDVPDSVVILINSMLVKKMDRRIKTANEVLEKVHQCLRENNGKGDKP